MEQRGAVKIRCSDGFEPHSFIQLTSLEYADSLESNEVTESVSIVMSEVGFLSTTQSLTLV